MIVQNKPNSTNFGNITKFRVRTQDLEHFQKNIHKKFAPGQNLIFNENLIHPSIVTKITEQKNIEAIQASLSSRGFQTNESLRLNSKDKHYNIYLVNEEKDLKKVFKNAAGFTSKIKAYFQMLKNIKWATTQIQPKNQFDKQVTTTLGLLKFSDEASQKFEQFAEKHGAKEFRYIAKQNGEIGLKPVSNKPTDGIKFKVPVKNIETFFETTFDRMANYLNKKNKPATFILDNPRYEQFEENFEKLEYGDWASKNLKYKGFDVEIPKAEDPKNTVDVYLFTSDNAQKKLSRKFDGPVSLLNFLKDAIKASSTTQKFSKMVGGATKDIHYKDAADFLLEHEINKHQNNRFKKLIEKMNLKEIDFKPKDN